MDDTSRNFAQWLSDNRLGKYADRFAENHIDFDVVQDLTSNDLREIGLSPGDRRRMLKAARNLGELRYIDIYGENLRESLKQVQRFLLLGLSTALFYFLVIIGGEAQVQLQGLPRVERPGAEFILLTAYIIAGFMAGWLLDRSRRLIDTLKRNDQAGLVDAILTLPSLPTFRIWGPRIGPAILPMILAVAGFVIARMSFEPATPRDGGAYVAMGLVVLFLVVPYAHLAVALKRFAGLQPDHVGD